MPSSPINISTSNHIICKIKDINKKQKQKQQHNNQNIKFLKYGQNHLMLVTENNELYAMGNNFYGQLGLDQQYYSYFSKFIKVEHSIDNIITLLECGSNFTIIVNNKNEFYISGEFMKYKNSYGIQNNSFYTLYNSLQFIKMNINLNEKIKFIRCGYNYLFIITKNNLIYGLGDNKNGQLGLQRNFKNVENLTLLTQNNIIVKDIQCGVSHSILLDIYGNIFVTGLNTSGQLGLTTNISNRFEFTKINLNLKIKEISCNLNSTIILTKSNELFCTGRNVDNKLGIVKDGIINGFTKIVMDFNNEINHLFKSFGEYNIITTINNETYFSGIYKDLYENQKFTKIKQLDKKCFIYPIVMEDVLFIVENDYRIVNEDLLSESVTILGMNCLKLLENKELIDLTFNHC